jgi:hypothetical protein
MRTKEVYPLQPKQSEFLQLVLTCDDMSVIALRATEKERIEYTVLYNFYTEDERAMYNSLRKNYKYLLQHSNKDNLTKL